jgi:predicted TIM-barrel fold metal-dependent hydrolase
LLIIVDQNGESHSIPLVDFHTHIGRVKIATTKGSSQRINQPQDILNLYAKLQYEIVERINKSPDKFWVTLPEVEKFAQPLFPSVKTIYSVNETKTRGWLVDKIVTFPFNDIFHTQTQPKFIKSNRYVRHQIHTFDNCFRFTSFCRVDPTDSESDQEVLDSIEQGMSGLKLHPLSQGWIEEIVSPETKRVLTTAGDLRIPVIFDVPNKGVAADITKITKEAREAQENPVNVVLGHSGFDYSSTVIFKCLAQDGIFAESSGMRGKDVEIFFDNLIKLVPNWECKIVFGTDHNYFSVLQAADVISYLFSKKFLDLLHERGQTIDPICAISNILGGNALNLIPISWNTIEGKAKSRKYKIRLGDFQKIIKKFISTEGKFIKVDLGKNMKKNQILQVITFGEKEARLTYSLQETASGEEVVLRSISQEIQKVEFSCTMTPLQIEKITKPSRGDKKIKAEKFKELLFEGTSQD